MDGDRLIITDYHRAAARQVLSFLKSVPWPEPGRPRPIALSVSGESGAGKSEVAECLRQDLESAGHRCALLCQDDYFRLPPHSNGRRRAEDIAWVGPGEVQLDLLDDHVRALREGGGTSLVKPLVDFNADRIGEEEIAADGWDAVLVEGTYTAMLPSLDYRVFIARDYQQTREARRRRARDPDSEFLERVLAIEHEIISAHRARADVVIAPPEEDQTHTAGA